MPSGDALLAVEDTLILFITKGAHVKLERLFGKKVEMIS